MTGTIHFLALGAVAGLSVTLAAPVVRRHHWTRFAALAALVGTAATVVWSIAYSSMNYTPQPGYPYMPATIAGALLGLVLTGATASALATVILRRLPLPARQVPDLS